MNLSTYYIYYLLLHIMVTVVLWLLLITKISKALAWKLDPEVPDGFCNLPRILGSELTQAAFLREFDEQVPFVVLLDGEESQQNIAFRNRVASKEALISRYGDRDIVLASSNQRSYMKKRTTLTAYLTEYINVDIPSTIGLINGSEIWYWFGDLDLTQWKELLDMYDYPYLLHKEPQERSCKAGVSAKKMQLNRQTTLTFGVGQQYSGVPFHTHGPVLAETIIGRKRWYLYPPDANPTFDGDEPAYVWHLRHQHEYTELQPYFENLVNQQVSLCSCDPMELLACTLHPQELLYIPSLWWHMTLNLEEIVFVSSFI